MGIGRHGGAAGAVALGLACAAAAPARADFTICNDSFDVINVAVGHEGPEGFATEGWWTIGTNRCAVALRGTLSVRYLYVYATDVLGQPILSGDTDLCISDSRFEIRGAEACWQRGHIAAPFVEIDTGAAPAWTLFVGGAP
jgi:uncharacterized membrane protein